MEAVGIGAYFHFLSGQYRCDFFEKWGRDFTVHKHSLDGVAYAWTLRLCVNDYLQRHVEICFPVHICNADADVMLDHWHTCVPNNCFDQGPPATRNNEIDVLVHLGHMPHGIATSFWNEQNTVFRQPRA